MSEEQIATDHPTARLTVAHTHKDDFGGRSIHLWLDGEKIATLPTGKSITKEIAAGHHTLRADNTFLPKTVEFDILPGEHLHYLIWNRVGFGSWLIGVFGSGPLYLMMERQPDSPLSAEAEKSQSK